jgi:hypothetical protein
MRKRNFLLILLLFISHAIKSESILSVLESRYSLYEFKKNNALDDLTLTSPKILKNRRLLDNSYAYLDYLDGLHEYIGKFTDTHLLIEEMNIRPLIFNGISLVLIGRQVYVYSVQEDSSKFANQYQGVSIGDELIEINNKQVLLWIKDLARYIPSSSNEYTLKIATQNLSERRYRYPKNNNFTWKFKSKKSKKIYLRELRYFVNQGDVTKHKQAQEVLKKSKILATTAKATEKYPKRHLFGQSHFNLEERKDILDGRGHIALTVGKLRGKNHLYTYIKFNEFTSSELKFNNKNMAIDEVIANILLRNKTEKLIILDLRYNGGGSGEVANSIFEKIIKKNTETFFWTTKYRNTEFYNQLYLKFKESFSIDEKTPIEEMFNNKSEYSRFSFKYVKGHSDITNKVIVLTGPGCISTCDIFSRLMKVSGQTIIGRPTNGTGSGFNSGGIYRYWTDPLGLFSIRIPVYLIGPSGKLPAKFEDPTQLNTKHLVENQAILPSILVEETWKEYILKDMSHWFNAFSETF